MASTILTRTATATGNNKILTWSGWVKRSDSSTGQLIAANGDPGSSDYIIFFEFTGAALRFIIKSLSIVANVNTNAVFRDTSAWYHLVFNMDTTQATASDRVKMYVNGEQITSFATSSYPSQNLGTQFNNADSVISVGGKYVTGANTDFFNGSMSHVHFIDGTVYGPSTFGETDTTTGQWKIKTDVSVNYGTNGFFILKDGNSVTDQSGQGNNLTVGGGTLTNTEDSPSNVFCNWNALSSSSYQTLSNGNSTSSGNTSLDNGNVYANLAVTKGKYYAEFKVTVDSGYPFVGIANMEKAGYYGTINGGTAYIGSSNLSPNVSYDSEGRVFQDGSLLATYTIPVTNDIIGLAVDLDNGAFYASINGTWQNSGDPTSGASKTGAVATWTPIDTLYTFGTANYNSGDTKANFGNGFFGTTAVASAGTNASGIGIFEYDVPTGYTALSTKGLNL